MDTPRAKMTMPAVHLVWFKRDLRTFDHAPLVHAAAAGLVLPIYLAEPAYWQQPDTSARQWRFIATSLKELAADLTALGGPLWVRVGDALNTLRALLDALPIAAVWSHAETGNDFTFKRDCAVAALLRARGIPWHEFRQDAVRQQRTTVDADLLQAYATGRTGLPLIDACMHRLQATGWINFRMRALLAAFGCYHLWQPWTSVGQVLARLFIDYEPGIHWSQMQMQSGSTGINAFRIYNPLKQSVDQDPEGTFIRQWLPELRAVPTLWIHEPWRMPEAVQIEYGCRIGVDYPAPIIEPLAAARVAKARLREAYATTDARAESLAVFIKHGSRKRRRTAQAQAATPQLSLFD